MATAKALALMALRGFILVSSASDCSEVAGGECDQITFLQLDMVHPNSSDWNTIRREAGAVSGQLDWAKWPTENVTASKAITDCIDAIFPLLREEESVCEADCGDISKDPPQMSAYIKLASDPSVKTICETGFFIGKSSALMLCSNPNATLYNFEWKYSAANLKVIQDTFGDRFVPTEGDSTVTLTQFANDPNSPFCDIMIADGGREDPVPETDMRNFAKIASKTPDRKHTYLVDEIYFYRETIDCCLDNTAAYERALAAHMIDTSHGFCQPLECPYLSDPDTSCHGREIPIFPISGEVTMASKNPDGGFCAFSFAKAFLSSA